MHHLKQALKNATERGLSKFQSPAERDQYGAVLANFFESDEHSEALRREAMCLLSLSETPNLDDLNDVYNRSLCVRTAPQAVNAAPYLSSFFDALIEELYADPFFRQQMSDVLQIRASANMQQSLVAVVSVLCQISETLADNYTAEHFAHDVATYTACIERAFHYLKIVGHVPKDQNKDPELNGIFVPLRIALADQTPSRDEQQDSITAMLEECPYLVLLGGPGSGKSTATRHLAWCHAAANQDTASPSTLPLLSGNPLPLRIELRRLTEDRRQHPSYNFLSYATEVILGREGVEVKQQMFKELLQRRAMLLLFDGLDEVASLDERNRLVEEIEHFALCYPGNRIIVTSRPVGYDLARLSNQIFSHANVQDFDDTQIRQFLENWYTYMLRRSPIPHQDRQELETLFKALKDNPRLHKLAENPLLLTVITQLHRYETLPDKRVQVYDKCADLLLDTWAKHKGTHARWKDMKMGKEDQRVCVAHLGFILHDRSQKESNSTQQIANVPSEDIASDVPTRFILREIEHFLREQKVITEVAEQRAEAKRFLELMQVEAGLIVERGKDESGEDLYGFVHRTFQEYFAAADVHERYQQEADPTIISDFLQEHLHDPHWREVILLLLGKLVRKPVTFQLRQILAGSINSSRSQYTAIVQQDLFFVCKCLAEEIVVENELAEVVISRLSDLVKTSPFPSQREEAVKYLGSLLQTRQHADAAREALIHLVTKDTVPSLLTNLQILQALYVHSPAQSVAQQQSIHLLTRLMQRPDLSVEQSLQAAQTLCRSRRSGSSERQFAMQLLMGLVQQPDVSFEQSLQAAQTLSLYSPSASSERQVATQLLMTLVQRPDLSVEQSLQSAQALYNCSPRESSERQFAMQLLMMLVQYPDLSVEQSLQAAQRLYRNSLSASSERQFATEWLMRQVQRLDLSFGQSLQTAQALYESSPRESSERQFATEWLMKLVQHPDLSFGQSLHAAQVLYRSSPLESSERQFATQWLMKLVQEPTLSLEQTLQAAQRLYRNSLSVSSERRRSLEILWQIARDQSIHADQRLQAAAVPLTTDDASYSDKLQSVQMVLTLVQGETAKKYLEEHWRFSEGFWGISAGEETDSSDIPYIIELSQQEMLPTQARDYMYRILRGMVAQFDKLNKANTQPAP